MYEESMSFGDSALKKHYWWDFSGQQTDSLLKALSWFSIPSAIVWDLGKQMPKQV